MRTKDPTTAQAVGWQASSILTKENFSIGNCHLRALNNHEELTVIQR